MENLTIWDAVKQPPAGALRQIQAGRLKGKSDINPQWRYKIMTEQFGPCGIGWKFDIVKIWTEPGCDNQVFSCSQINLFIKVDGQWSEPIPGVGGHMLVVKESAGLHANDEGFKMATTDALGTAMKMIGVAADVYAGLWDGSKYNEMDAKPGNKNQDQKPPFGKDANILVPGSDKWIINEVFRLKIDAAKFQSYLTSLGLTVGNTIQDTLTNNAQSLTPDRRAAITQKINATAVKEVINAQSK